MLVVNFKAYREAQAEGAVEIAEECQEAAEETGKEVIVCPSSEDLRIVNSKSLKVFSQHTDPFEPGSHTGSTTAESIHKAGADGTLLNHSENRMEKSEIRRAIELCQKNNLKTVVCAQDPEECRELAGFDPDYIAFEPPELIGGKKSVSDSKPELIKEAVESSSVPTLTGAGIKTRQDVEKSVELGCKGVLVASGVVKADNIKEEVKELCQGL